MKNIKALKIKILLAFKLVIKYLFLLCVGGSIYCSIELVQRGRTHWTMFVVGGLCFIFCGLVNELLSWDMLIWKQMAICTVGITLIEFISGCIINILLGWNVWDYSNQPFNILGQVCLLYSGFWYLLSYIAIILDDYLRYWFFKEEKPRYKLK